MGCVTVRYVFIFHYKPSSFRNDRYIETLYAVLLVPWWLVALHLVVNTFLPLAPAQQVIRQPSVKTSHSTFVISVHHRGIVGRCAVIMTLYNMIHALQVWLKATTISLVLHVEMRFGAIV
jgi:hypothetical protein